MMHQQGWWMQGALASTQPSTAASGSCTYLEEELDGDLVQLQADGLQQVDVVALQQ